ncbi:MAG: HAMP domain-containing histidine kinase [Lachnospiraceae bacterium]|nr:HAMP domain-containing histidine kinase [Lachnospiraceae bacterium]
MKDKFVEGLRQFLLKTWVPLQKRKDAWLGRLRLSMSFRINLNYMKLMIINGVIFMAVFIVLYMDVQSEDYQERAEALLVSVQTGDMDLTTLENPYQSKGVRVCFLEKESGKVLYDDRDFQVEGFLFLKNIHIDPWDSEHRVVIQSTEELLKQGVLYEAVFHYNLTPEYNQMLRLLLNMILLYMIIVICILQEAKSQNARLLKPIKEMSDTANRLTMNNLHSERLNIQGTNDELRELAEVFNDMLDRMETSYESQKQFVSDASHELRTPIAVVQGYANMLKRWGSRNQEVLEESVEAISNEAAQMQDLVEKLLFLSRHDKKTLKLKKEYFNMRPIVEEMVKETKLVSMNRNIEAPYLQNVRVYGDKQALKQAIRVFIDNAQKYTEDGDTIRISCQNVHGDCVLTVEDTGIGMKRRDLDNIFSRFYRADDVRDKKIEGHGLGLSIAKLIIMAHTGRIKIRTQYTKGTSFIVTVPRIR